MLVDIVPLYSNPNNIPKNGFWETLSQEEKDELIPCQIQKGVWDTGLNPSSLIEMDNIDDPIMTRQGNLLHLLGDTRSALEVLSTDGLLKSYGVCDDLDNLLQHPQYKDILGGPRLFTICLAGVRRDSQPERGGWRWHKWGPYIGSYEIQHEYLYDEDIEGVVLFEILEHIPRVEQLTTDTP